MSGDDDEESSSGIQSSCPICLLELRLCDKVSALNCGHIFHFGCINQWLSAKKQCPSCRKVVPRSGFIEKLYFNVVKEPEADCGFPEINYEAMACKLTAALEAEKETNKALDEEVKSLKHTKKALEKKILKEKDKTKNEIPRLQSIIDNLRIEAAEIPHLQREATEARNKLKAAEFYKILHSQHGDADKQLNSYLKANGSLNTEKFFELMKTQNKELAEMRRQARQTIEKLTEENSSLRKSVEEKNKIISTLKSNVFDLRDRADVKTPMNKRLQSILDEIPTKRVSMGFDETNILENESMAVELKENETPGPSSRKTKTPVCEFSFDTDEEEYFTVPKKANVKKDEENKKNGEDSFDFSFDIPVPQSIVKRMPTIKKLPVLPRPSVSKAHSQISPDSIIQTISLKRKLSQETKQTKTIKMIDVHCHLADNKFKEDLDEVIRSAIAAGVEKMVVVPEFESQFEKVIEMSKTYRGTVYAGIGVHPIQKRNKSVKMKHVGKVEEYMVANETDVICVGEVGLDHTVSLFKLDEQDLEEQEQVFNYQIDLAKQFEKPLNVHSRSAARKTIEVLRKAEVPPDRCVLHAFDGSVDDALLGIESGYLFSVPPSFIESERAGRVIEAIPLDLILLETDSPALGPVKKARNVPENVHLCAEYVARLKNKSIEEVIRITTENAHRVFEFLKPDET